MHGESTVLDSAAIYIIIVCNIAFQFRITSIILHCTYSGCTWRKCTIHVIPWISRICTGGQLHVFLRGNTYNCRRVIQYTLRHSWYRWACVMQTTFTVVNTLWSLQCMHSGFIGSSQMWAIHIATYSDQMCLPLSLEICLSIKELLL